MKKGLYIVVFSILSAGALFAQNKSVARKHFLAGEYSVAKPMFEKLLKRNPRNGELNYWYAVCCYETKDTVPVKGMLEFAASRKITNAHRYLGDLYADSCDYAAAAEKYEDFIDVATDDSLLAVYRAKLNRVNRLYRMVSATEKICVVDSVVVDRDNFLSAYKMGYDAASLHSVADFFGANNNDGGYLSKTERGIDIYCAVRSDSLLKLHHSTLVGERWSEPVELAGFDTGGNDNFPFMLSDGLTLYFASDGEGSVGGYDIFVTRYDSESGRYLRPDNVGMPFNSTANDYMMAVNEVAGLGWFASDRYQPDGKVCVYVFVYSDAKERFDVERDGYEKVLRFAQMRSIAATQEDADVVRNARRRLAMLLYEGSEEKKTADFIFVIDDMLDYTALSDFKSDKARALFKEWQKRCVQQEKDVALLQQKRDAYAVASNAERERLSGAILELERKVDCEYGALQKMECEIRRLEIGVIYK
ncbi:MAG: hypothetical protein IJZ22_05695 [Bacteroidaceae bacterium]|nr:hypothetical protein [Bacteroidaceae bacterium]